MQDAIEQIATRYHPKQLTFTRASAKELLAIFGKTQEELDLAWLDIENSLAKRDLWMMPALPDAEEDEEIRIYRRTAPLTRILLEALTPSPNGDRDVMVPAIKALNQIVHRNQSAGQPRRDQQTPPQKTGSSAHRHNGGARNSHKRHTRHPGSHGQRGVPDRSGPTVAQTGRDDYDSSYSASARHLTRPLD
jgi:hypothetical protein